MMALKDKVAIITGAASGIGLATARALAREEAKVVLSDINVQAGQHATEELQSSGAAAIFVEVDVAVEESVKNLVTTAVKHFGILDIMVNNAGVGTQLPTEELTFDEYKRTVSINQDGVFLGSKYAIMEMLKTGGGCVVNVSSIMGLVGAANACDYCASKGAVTTLSKALAAEYANRNIRVNSVHPGYVFTGMVSHEVLEALGTDLYKRLVALHPIGRFGQPEEIAHGIVFLCENEFVTGSSLAIDGGYTAV